MRRLVLGAALLACSRAVLPQAAAREEPSHPPHAIQDNSFLVEEAYNQEEGIVQHISTFLRTERTGEWVATFTQEYPVSGIAHQVSYTVPFQRVASETGLGDVALNYRYQLLGDDRARVAVAPRLTLFLPTGNGRKGLGAGAVGIQVSLPASTVVSENWIAHWNVGATFTPSARNERGEKANALGYNLGQSVIWLGRSVDVLLETVWSRSQSVAGPGATQAGSSLLISPGVRWAYNLAGGLQIVPGIAIPIGLGPSHGERSILLYLSFEHPFQ